MTASSKFLLIVVGAASVALGAASGARAWDTERWDPSPFDRPGQIPAAARAKIARVEAEGMARAGAAGGDTAATSLVAPSLSTDGQRGCAVNVGNVVLPQRVLGAADASTNVQIKGDVITVCR